MSVLDFQQILNPLFYFTHLLQETNIFSTAGVSFFLIPGHTGHELDLRFVAPDKAYCSTFKCVHTKASKKKVEETRQRGLSLWTLFFFDHPPLSARLAGHSSHLGNLWKQDQLLKKASERVKFSSRVSSSLPSWFMVQALSHSNEKKLSFPFWNQLSSLHFELYPLKHDRQILVGLNPVSSDKPTSSPQCPQTRK